MEPETTQITQLLDELRDGQPQAEEKLLPLVYQELRRIASRYMGRERANHTLQTTALVHEAYIRMVGQEPDIDWQNRAHFFAMAATVMRRILVDYARAKRSRKRGGSKKFVVLDEALVFNRTRLEDILSVDEALSSLQEWDPRQARIVEMRFFGGLTEQEIAETLEVSTRTVKRDWRMAKAWLRSELSRQKENSAG